MKKKRRPRRRPFYHRVEPTDGLEVNQLSDNRHASKFRAAVSIFDYDNVTLDDKWPYRTVSIMRRVSKVNGYRSMFLGKYNSKTYGQ